MSQTNIIFNRIIDKSIKSGASYVHLEVGSKPVIRSGGRLERLEEEQIVNVDFLNDLAQTILSPEERNVLDKDKSLVVVKNFESNRRFRVDIFYQKKTLAFAFKYIQPVIKDIKKFGLSDEFIKLFQRREGLIIISGQHGSGKTAITASILEFINKSQSKYILTLEKPIEYILNPQKSIIEQREIGRDAHTFAEAIKFAQYGDADVVALSEIDSFASLARLFELIESGRLGVVIVEADSVPEAVEQLINLSHQTELEKSRQVLSDLLLGVIVEHFLPRRGGGQIGIAEILITIPPVSSLIKEGKYQQLNTVMQTSRDDGMCTKDQYLIELVRTGEVAYEDALLAATDKLSFRVVAK